MTTKNVVLSFFIFALASSSLTFASDISSLIKRLGDWDKDKAKEASEELARIGKPAVLQLTEALSSKNTHRRRYASRALMEIGQDASDAIPSLSKLIDDRDDRTREYVVRALGSMLIQAEQVLPILKNALTDKNKDVAVLAEQTIERIYGAFTDKEKLAKIVKHRINLDIAEEKCVSLMLEEKSINKYIGIAEFEDDVKRRVVVNISGVKVEYKLEDGIAEDKSGQSNKDISPENSISRPIASNPETVESNEAVERLYNCEVFAKNIWSQVYLSPELKDIPTDLEFTIGDLLTHAYLYKDEEGTRIESKVFIIENNVRLRLDIPKDGREDVGGLVFNFSVEDFSVKDPGGVIEGNIAEGHGAILTDAYMHFNGVRIGETFQQLAAAKLLKTMLTDSVSETNPLPSDVAEATKRARRMLSGKVDIQFEYKDIDSGPYGIPLNASFDKVISWCNEKNFQVTDSVEKVPVFESIEFVEDGRVRKVKDNEFIEDLYKLELAPSEELRNEDIGTITVYFQKTTTCEYNSYATLFCYSRHRAPYVTLNTMTQVLNQKYGNFEIIPISSKDKGIGSQIHTLTGMGLNCTDAVIWKRNIILLGKFMYNEAQEFRPPATPRLEPSNRSEPFYLLYFTPSAGTSIPYAYENAVEMCKKNYSREKEASKKRMVDTF